MSHQRRTRSESIALGIVERRCLRLGLGAYVSSSCDEQRGSSELPITHRVVKRAFPEVASRFYIRPPIKEQGQRRGIPNSARSMERGRAIIVARVYVCPIALEQARELSRVRASIDGILKRRCHVQAPGSRQLE